MSELSGLISPCLGGAGGAGAEDRTIISFLEELRAAWDLERSSLYADNRAQLQTAARLWTDAPPRD